MEARLEMIKALIELSPTVEEADDIINEYFGFETSKEKIAFLKGMFEVEVIDVKRDDSDEMIYNFMLNAIINAKYL